MGKCTWCRSLDLAPLLPLEEKSVKATTILTGETVPPRLAESLLKQSLLYREFQAEHEEILRHKWYESEKKGHDIGIELAQIDWRIKHGSHWRKDWQQKRSRFAFEI